MANFDVMSKYATIAGVIVVISGFVLFGTGHGFFGSLALILGLILAVVPSCLWFVETGQTGFLYYFKKLQNKSYGAGMHFRIPGISEISNICIQVITKVYTDAKKTLSRNSIFIKYALTWQLVPTHAHLVLRLLGKNYVVDHLEKWVDAITDTLISQLSYPHFQAKKAEVEEWLSKLVQTELIKKSSEITKEVVDGSFIATLYRLEPVVDPYGNPVYETVSMGDDRTEQVQKFELLEEEVELEGVNLFKNVSVKLNEVKFEEGYEKAQAQIKIKESELEAQKIENERKIAEADAELEVTRRKIQGKKEHEIARADANEYALMKEASGKGEKISKLTEAYGGDSEKALSHTQAESLRDSKLQTLVQGGGATPMVNVTPVAVSGVSTRTTASSGAVAGGPEFIDITNP